MVQWTKEGTVDFASLTIGEWTEVIATVNGIDYQIGSVRNGILKVEFEYTEHYSIGKVWSFTDLIFGHYARMTFEGLLEEIHRENLHFLLEESLTGSSTINIENNSYPAQFFTLHGKRHYVPLSQSNNLIEFCMYKCRMGDLIKLLTDEEGGKGIHFKAIALDDTRGDFGGSKSRPYGWIFINSKTVSVPGGSPMAWNQVDDHIIPILNNAYDIGQNSTPLNFRNGYFAGHLYASYFKLTPVNPGSPAVPNGSLFMDSTDGNKLKFKDWSGVIFEVSSYSTPSVYGADTVTNHVGGLPDGDTDQIDLSAPSSGSATLEGLICNVELIDYSGINSGDVRVRIYNDQSRTEMIFERIFNLADSDLIDRLSTHFLSDNVLADGAIYVDITNNTGYLSRFQVNIRIANIIQDGIPAVGAGTGVNATVAGDGFSFDGTRLNVDLDSDPGLELTGATPNGKLRVKAFGNVERTASGINTTSNVVLVDTVQTVTASKRFNAGKLGLIPHGTDTGAPIAGAWIAGDLFVDANLNLFRCILTGTPGTWQFWGGAYSEGIDYNTLVGEENAAYTDLVVADSHIHIELIVAANRGVFRRLLIWATDPSGPDDFPATEFDFPYRVVCHPNESLYGREQLWSISGQARKTYLTGAVSLSNVVPVMTVDQGAPDDLVRLRRKLATVGEEYGRITVRTTSPIQFEMDEDVINTFAQNDPMMFVTEFVELPWMNNSVAEPRKIFLTLFNDGEVGVDPDVKFGYQYDVEYFGGGSDH
jgi:hypothetical protein